MPFPLRVLAVALLAFATTGDADASLLEALGDMDSKARLWLAAVGGLSLGIAFGALVLEARSRRTAVALRRLTDLAAGVDGRLLEATQRSSVAAELARLSDEILYTTQRVARERREHAAQTAAWEAAFAASLDATVLLDDAGAITRLNPAAERLFKVKADEVIGQPFVDVALPAGHRSGDHATFARDLSEGRAQGRRQELVAHRSDGRQFPIEVAIAEFSQPSSGFVLTAHDISSVRRMRAELARRPEAGPSATARSATAPAVTAPAVTATTATAPSAASAITASATALAAASTSTAGVPPGARPAAVTGPSFTLDEVCGDMLRKLAARAERRGLGFRYEDGEVQGLALRGDSSRLRRTLINLIDSIIKVLDSGEIIVHLIAVPAEDNRVEVMAAVTATAMFEAQAARLVKPFVTDSVVRAQQTPYPGRATHDRRIDFLGTRVTLMRTAGGGSTFRFGQQFDVDLSRVTIDLTTVTAAVRSASIPAEASSADVARARTEFARAATRLRKNAERTNLVALWAEAHRLNGLWLKHGDPAQPGLVTALAHTARGGDATNAVTLARRFADALEQRAGQTKAPAPTASLAAV